MTARQFRAPLGSATLRRLVLASDLSSATLRRLVLASDLSSATLRRLVLAAGLGLAGCASSEDLLSTSGLPDMPKVADLNPFKEKSIPLPGKRIAVMDSRDTTPTDLADANHSINLPLPHDNADWAQPGGQPNNAPGHLALNAALKKSWNVTVGDGSSKLGRITASPVVYQGRIYTLDAKGRVASFDAASGAAGWTQSLEPTAAKGTGGGFFGAGLLSLGGSSSGGGGYGGGLAADSGRLYATSGYGTVTALDPATGAKVWEKNIGVPIRAAPTVADDKVFVITSDGQTVCLASADGAEAWVAKGLPQTASLVMNVSAAVDGGVVVVPYTSGDVVAMRIADGTVIWTDSLARNRTTSQLTSLADAARPAIDGGVVFAVGHAGRMIASKAATGERLWAINVPGTQMPWVAGEAVFVVDTGGQLSALSRADGKTLWAVKMPGTVSWSGPVLAGGVLWLVSSKGTLAAVDPATGKLNGQDEIGGPIYVPPIVANGRLYLLTDKARLIALN